MADGVGTLWHAIYKINAGDNSFHWKSHMAEITEADARIRCTAIGGYLRNLMPTSCEITFASVNKDNHEPDSRYVSGGVGVGLYGTAAIPPVETEPDADLTCLKLRFESSSGQVVPRKLAPLPDGVVEGNRLTTAVAGITIPVGGAIGAPGAGADWFAELSNFLKYLGTNTHHVRTGHAPGGPYTYYTWAAIIPWRIGKKRGGRRFV